MSLPVNYKAMNTSEYKSYHEHFMQHNLGSTPVHTFSYIFLVVLCTVVSSIFRSRNQSQQYVFEYVVIVVPLILGYTMLSDYVIELNYIVAIVLCVIVVFHRRSANLRAIFNENNVCRTEKLLALTLMRSLTYLITAFSILGVDFRVYPRFLAKTEAYGYSVMDTGVGLFVLMSGLVHKDYSKDKITSFMKNNLKLFTVLSALGISRFLSVKHLDYHEHVTEYGVHWNFFFTLAVAKVLSSIILFFCNSKDYSLILSVLVIVLHESMLYMGLETWVFSSTPRNSFLNANREGFSSCLGYVALYLAAVHFKHVILDKKVLRSCVLAKLLLGAGLSWILTSVNEYRPISRTLANLGYWTYLLAILLTVLAVLYFFEVLLEGDQKHFLTVPNILSDIHYNGLLYFLSANLLTGAVNLSMRTLFVGGFSAIIILNVYMVSTIAIAVFLKRKQIRI